MCSPENRILLFAAMALMAKSVLKPEVHSVPAAMAMTTDHWPLAQRWYEDPPRQFHSPSAVQAPDKASEVDVVEDDELAAGAELATTEAAAADVTAGATEVAATVAPDAATVAKTPAEAAGAVVTAAEVAPVAEAAEPADAVPDSPATIAWQLPVGVARAEEVAKPSCSTESPGLGKSRSVES